MKADQFLVAVLVSLIQLQRVCGLNFVSDHQRLVLLVALAYPNGVWWLRLGDQSVSPLLKVGAVLMAIGGPVVWVGRLLMEVSR